MTAEEQILSVEQDPNCPKCGINESVTQISDNEWKCYNCIHRFDSAGAAILTPEQKILSVERQIAECACGNSKEIVCPYCQAVNVSDNERLCCALFGKAVMAVLDRIRFLEAKGNVERILDQAARN